MNATLIAALGEQVQKAIASAVDPLNARIKELEARPSYDGSDLRSEVKALRDGWDGIKKSIPEPAEPYDDTALRSEIDRVISEQKERVEMLARAAAERPEPPAPRDGVDGRDALHLEILPAIDETKSYTRNTYAKHAGGLWRAFEQTSGMRGWECIVDGIKEVQVGMEGKALSVRAVMSSGALSEMVKELPIQIYRGVFSEEQYHRGDTVTWAGSLWHCNATGTKAKPGDGSTDWTLAVKKGRDGKEVVTLPRAQGPVKIGD